MSNNKFLITGASGLIGSSLVHHLMALYNIRMSTAKLHYAYLHPFAQFRFKRHNLLYKSLTSLIRAFNGIRRRIPAYY